MGEDRSCAMRPIRQCFCGSDVSTAADETIARVGISMPVSPSV